MADDTQLSADDIKELQDVATALPAGDARKNKIVKFLASRQTDFEKQNANTSYADYQHGLGQYTEPERLAARALSSAGLPETLRQTPTTIKNAYESGFGLKPAAINVADAFAAPSQRSIVKAVPFVGPLSVSMADAAKTGDYTGAGADLAGALSLTKALPQVPSGLSAARNELIDATRTPTNKLTTGTKALSSLAGGVAGHYMGIPGAGELGGLYVGPRLADAFLPKRPPKSNTFGGAYIDPNPPVFPGAQLPSASDFYANEGKLRMDLMKQAVQRGDVSQGNPFSPPPRSAPDPFEPVIVENDAELNALNQRKRILQNEAKSAGLYSAARGKVGKKYDYQQRIERDFE